MSSSKCDVFVKKSGGRGRPAADAVCKSCGGIYEKHSKTGVGKKSSSKKKKSTKKISTGVAKPIIGATSGYDPSAYAHLKSAPDKSDSDDVDDDKKANETEADRADEADEADDVDDADETGETGETDGTDDADESGKADEINDIDEDEVDESGVNNEEVFHHEKKAMSPASLAGVQVENIVTDPVARVAKLLSLTEGEVSANDW